MSNKLKPKAKRGLTPRLRFPEFQDAPEWERKQLSELLFETKQRNKKLEYGPQDVLSVSGEYGCVNQIKFLGRSYAGASVKDYHVVETGDIVYTKSPLKKNPFGIIKENKGKPGIVSTLYAIYRVTDIGHPTYLDHYFSRDYNLNSYLQPIVNKGAKNDMKVKNSAVLGGEILIPKIDEQRKIADCLTSLDDLIAAHSHKLDALKAHKKGLLQPLFPAEDETVPRLRFPEFRDAGEWEIKQLGTICNYWNGAGHENSITEDGDYYLISLNSIDIEGNLKPDMKKLSYTDNSLQKNDLIIVLSDVAHGNFLGLTDIIPNNSFVLNQRMGGLRIRDNNLVSVNFLRFFINLNQYYFKRKGQGSSQLNLSKSSVMDFPVYLPKIDEQRKIADCLTSLDDLIAAHSHKLDALKAHKKGLLQQLFLLPEEVQR